MNGRKEGRARLLLVILMILALMATGCGGGGGGSDTDSPEDTIGDDTTPGDTTGDTTTGDDSPHVTITTYDVPGAMPTKLAIDGSNNIWVINRESNTVTKFNSSGAVSGTYTVVNSPSGITIDNNNNVWVDSVDGLTILDNSGTQIASNSTCYRGIAADASGNIYSYHINQSPPEACVSLMNVTTGEMESCISAWTIGGWNFTGLLIDADNNFWLSDLGEIAKYDQSGSKLATIADEMYFSASIVSDSASNIWFVKSNSITKLNSFGIQVLNFPISAPLRPQVIAVDGDDNLWVACFALSTYQGDWSAGDYSLYYYDSVLKYDADGKLLASYPQFNDMKVDVNNPSYPNPFGIAIDGLGNVWVTNTSNNKISKIAGVAAPVNTPYQPGK